jgi:uncharacterized repeat protein (TIGR03837 family)
MMRWDIFCRVIDNFGDLGVCWRLAQALASRGQTVRLWADDASALAWMAPPATGGAAQVEVKLWQPDAAMPADALPGDVVIEAFGCEIDHAWIASKSIALGADFIRASSPKGFKNPIWINLEYLSAEAYVERSHGLRSPVLQGPALGMDKWFFYPGFTDKTGGVMQDFKPLSLSISPPNSASTPDASPTRTSLFCYEPPALPELLQQLVQGLEPTQLIVMQGRAQAAVKQAFQSKTSLQPLQNKRQVLSIQEQSYLSQVQYDALLASCALNFVRGEDSLVRALLAGRAFVWQIYPQQDGAHAAKLDAFLNWLQAPPDWREFHQVWNGLSTAPLPPIRLDGWTACAEAARQRLLAQTDLVTQLLDFVEEKQAQTQHAADS